MTPRTGPSREQIDLFLISVLILFLELACIRWFPAHVLFLTFFTNVVLLACFLGMSVGCLAAEQQATTWTGRRPCSAWPARRPSASRARWRWASRSTSTSAARTAPQVVFFGTEYNAEGLDNFRIPIEVVAGFFFLVIALAFVGPGQELGRALDRVPDRVQAYTVNIVGSVVGIVLFAACPTCTCRRSGGSCRSPPGWPTSWCRQPRRRGPPVAWAGACSLLLVVILVAVGGAHRLVVFRDTQDGELTASEFLWSPYYRIDYARPAPQRDDQGQPDRPPGDARPRTTCRPSTPCRTCCNATLAGPRAGGKPFEDVLIIGAGSGNDVSRGLQWGAEHIDAVEIDPVIQRLGETRPPDAARTRPTRGSPSTSTTAATSSAPPTRSTT